MFKNMKFILLAVFLIYATSCSDSNKKDLYKGFSPKMLFSGAKEKSNDGAYKESLVMYQELQARYPASKYATQSKLETPFTLYKSGEYDKSIDSLNEYIILFPYNSASAYAYYLRGLASENKSASFLDDISITDNASRDVSSVKDALNYYLALIEKFPNNKYSIKANSRLVILKNILARHELIVAIFYTNRPAAIAAINRCKYIIEHYPNTPSVPAALHLIAYNYDSLGKKNLAKDARRVLKASYPKYKKHYSLK
jgi:outer membrane protein assembly factor BamD